MERLFVDADRGKHKIPRHVYGHFAEHLGRCVYEGIWVGEGSPIANTRGARNDVIAALSKLRMPNLRWPGGCFADTYHWMDGIGARSGRPSIVNIHWGGITENNHFGTREFLDFCSLVGTEPYICGNVGSGTVREMAEWLEYITMPGKSPMADMRRANGREEPWDVTFWGVGNENWGCGGTMTALQYAWEFRKFQGYCRHFGGRKLFKVACGFDDGWNETLMREAGALMDGLSVHYYTVRGADWNDKGPSTGFPVSDWYAVLRNALGIEDFIDRTATIMDRYDPQKRVAMVMDEWGTWHTAEPGTNPGFLYQQNTIRDALVAGLTLNIFNRRSDRLRIANIAQTINVLQAMILTDGPKMILTPTYHVFEMYAPHQDAVALPVWLQDAPIEWEGTTMPRISASASCDGSGKILLTLCNLHHEDASELRVELRGSEARKAAGRILTGPDTDSRNTFERPDAVKPAGFDGVAVSRGALVVTLPARSVVALDVT
jgi:alpha-N-arabinofuranosidase